MDRIHEEELIAAAVRFCDRSMMINHRRMRIEGYSSLSVSMLCNPLDRFKCYFKVLCALYNLVLHAKGTYRVRSAKAFSFKSYRR